MKKLSTTLFFLVTFCYYASCQEEEVTFQSEQLVIEGTLSIPELGTAPYPIAILVHGSGPNDRNQTATLVGPSSQCIYPDLFNQTITNFKDIADHLVENGVAVLRYDKRTLTHAQTLNEPDILVSDFIIDVESAINYVQSRNEIDAANIFLVGHSQGSGLIPIAAINSSAVKGLISLAGPTTSVDSLVTEQFRYIYEVCANDPMTAESVSSQLYQQFNEIREGTFPLDQQIFISIPGFPNPVPQGYGSFWSNWIEIGDNVLGNYSEANLKSLIIQGDDDFNVPFEDADDFSSVLNSEIKIYEGINHFLTPSNNNKVSVEILQDITEWIQSCAITSTENTKENQPQFEISRKGRKVAITSKSGCNNCLVELYSIDGKLLHSSSMNENTHELQLDPKPELKVLTIKGHEFIFSKVIH